MFKLLKGGECYAPDYLGKKDILVVGNKIYKIKDGISKKKFPNLQLINCEGCIVCPGFIDQHVHIIGGGGEKGPSSQLPEVTAEEIISAGVSTIVGLLGTDGITRNISQLLTKARALSEKGLTTYIYTGSYTIPPTTLTGEITKDIVYIDKIIGLGEIAIADHRSSHPSLQTIKELAAKVHLGGLIGKKPGIMHIHVGEGKEGLSLLFDLLENSEYPIDMFIPTHINRNYNLLQQGIKYCKYGGYIDLTAGEVSGLSIPDTLNILFNEKIDIEKKTVSSDGNGSVPNDDNSQEYSGKVMQLFDDIKKCVKKENMDLEKVLMTVTSNVAKILHIPSKGVLKTGSDADILIIKQDSFKLKKVIISGNILFDT